MERERESDAMLAEREQQELAEAMLLSTPPPMERERESDEALVACRAGAPVSSTTLRRPPAGAAQQSVAPADAPSVRCPAQSVARRRTW